MPVTNRIKRQHLLWRAGFGPLAEEAVTEVTSNPQEWYQEVSGSDTRVKELDVTDPYLRLLVNGNVDRMMVDDEHRRTVRKKNRDDIKKLNVAWLDEMTGTTNQLQEKMSLFWHGHFACRSQNSIHQQLLVNAIRRNALGNFGELLTEVSKTAAMLNFLNNNQNRKGHPNENFAREVMELFTMGRGHYSEHDVKEAARAFTGWGAAADGNFFFRKAVHDDGSKTIFSKTGNFDGDEVLKMLLERKETADFITTRVYRFFVNEEPDFSRISLLSASFYASNYNIRSLMKEIFTSDWFYDEKNIGIRIKSPIELLAGMRRMIPIEFENENVQLLIQRVLGQVLFYPPNVAGWPGGKNWIDSSSLMFRLRVPKLLADANEINIQPKEDDDQAMGMMETHSSATRKEASKQSKSSAHRVSATIDWNRFIKSFENTPREKLITALAGVLLQTKSPVSDSLLSTYIDCSSREQYIRTAAVQLMSTPEYQLC